MSFTINNDIYDWLSSSQLLKSAQISQQLSNGKVVLDEITSNQFLNGAIISKILQKLIESYPKSTDRTLPTLSNLDGLKTAMSPSSKLYNWNVIFNTLKKMDINVEQDVRSLIVAGDADMINDILQEIYSKAKKNGDSKSVTKAKANLGSLLNNVKSPVSSKNQKSVSLSLHSSFRSNKEKESRETINIDKMKVDKQLSQTQNLLEFFLVSVARAMTLSAQQTVQVLSNNHKYLAHIVVKGIKEVFEPIIKWLNDLMSNVNHLVSLMARDEDKKHTMVFVHHALKAGFISKDYDVAQTTCLLFQALAYEYLNQDLLGHAWDWFISEQGGLHYVLNCIKRHPDLAENAIKVILGFSKFNIMELFSHHLKKFHPDTKEFLLTIRELLKPLSESTLTRDEMVNAGIMDVWVDFALQVIDDELLIELKLLAVSFVCDVWMVYPSKIEENEATANKVILTLKKMTAEPRKVIKIAVFTELFRLLEYFCNSKNLNAPTIYKTLTSCMIENFSNFQIREHLLHNFKAIFKSIESIPIGVLIEPLVKHLQTLDTASQSMNLFDLEFLISVAQNPKLSLKLAIQLLDFFAKLYLNNIIFANIAGRGFIQILVSNMEAEPIQDYVMKFIKIALAILYNSEKSKKPMDRMLPRYNNKHVTSKPVLTNVDLEFEILNAQRRALIIEMIKNIINLGYDGVNNQTKTLLLFTNHQLTESLKIEQKGILILLSLFGNPNQIISHFEKNFAAESKRSLSRRGSLERSATDDVSRIHNSKLDSDGIDFFKELGLVPKKKKNIPEKLPLADLSALGRSKADPKTAKKLDEIRKSFTEKILKTKEMEELEKEKYEYRRKNLKNVIDKRMIELGVSPMHKQNVIESIIFEAGSREAEKALEKKTGLPEIYIVHLEHEEDRDRKGVEVVMRKYQKAIKNLFYSYANSDKDTGPVSKIEKNLQLISLPEIWKILRDHDLDSLLSQDELATLIRLTNTEIMKDSNLKWLSFDGFKNFLIQFAIFVFSRPPNDLSQLPVFCHLNELISRCREAEAKRSKNTVLYDDPDSTDTGDAELNKHLNSILKNDPNYPVPEAYQKIQEPDISFIYKLAPSLEISNSFRMAYELLDELLFQALKIRIVEPMSSYTKVTKAKLKLAVQTSSKLYQHEPFVLRTPQELPKDYTTRFQSESMFSPVKPIPMSMNLIVNLPLTIKLEIAKQPFNQRSLFSEVGLILNEVCDAVATGKPYKKEEQPIMNRFMEEKIRQKEKEQSEAYKHEKRRADYTHQLHDRMKILKSEREEQAKSKAQDSLAKNLLPNKKEQEWKRYHEEQKDLLKEHKYKQILDKEMQEKEKRNKLLGEREMKKKQFQEFNARKISELYQKIDKIKQSQADMLNKTNNPRKAKQEKELKLKRLQTLREEVAQYEQFKKDDEEIHNLMQKKEVRDVFQKYEKQIKQVYSWYCLSAHHAIGSLDQMETLLIKPYMAFASDFLIYPTIIKMQQVEAIFRSLTKVKLSVDGKQVSLTFDDFEESLLRMAIKGRVILDQIYSAKTGKGAKANEQNFSSKESVEDADEGEAEKPDAYEKISETTANTVQGLFYYLDLPQEKQALLNKLNGLKKNTLSLHEKKQHWKKVLQNSARPDSQPPHSSNILADSVNQDHEENNEDFN